MLEKECKYRDGVYKVQIFRTTHWAVQIDNLIYVFSDFTIVSRELEEEMTKVIVAIVALILLILSTMAVSGQSVSYGYDQYGVINCLIYDYGNYRYLDYGNNLGHWEVWDGYAWQYYFFNSNYYGSNLMSNSGATMSNKNSNTQGSSTKSSCSYDQCIKNNEYWQKQVDWDIAHGGAGITSSMGIKDCSQCLG
jgi:hypothetical protein